MLSIGQRNRTHTQPRRLLGQILVDGEFISRSDLDKALAEQRKSNERLGEILVRTGALDRRDLDAVLAVQGQFASVSDAVHAAAGVRQLLGELLLQARLITQSQLDIVLEEQKRTGEKLGTVLVRFGFLTQNELDTLLAFQSSQSDAEAGSKRLRLGELLVTTNQITRKQLEEVLARQKVSRKNIGDLLIEAGYVKRQQIEYGVRLQKKLVTAALVAALSLITLGSAQPADAAPTNAGSGSARIGVSAMVQARASLRVLAQPRELRVTETDVQRGYVDVRAGSSIEIRNNSRHGYLLAVENMGLPVRAVHVQGFGKSVQIAAGSGWISRPDAGRGTVREDLSYRFVLSNDTKPGTYAWPLSLSVLAK